MSRTMTVTVSGPCPPDEAWDRYVRPRRWREWSPEHDADGRALGSRTTLVVHGWTPVVTAYLPLAWIALRRPVR